MMKKQIHPLSEKRNPPVRRTKRVWMRFLALALCASLCVPAAAEETVSQFHSEPNAFGWAKEAQDGWSWIYVEDGSSLYMDGHSAWAGAWLRSRDGKTFPAGSLGVEARLYNEDGELCASTGMRYNTSEASFAASITSASPDGDCSCGHIRATLINSPKFTVYNSQRLTSGDAFTVSAKTGHIRFPQKMLDLIQENKDGYPENAFGEPYGSALLEGYDRSYWVSPVLLSAVGTNGVHGYVCETDLSPYLATRADAVAYMSELEENRVIPLYDKDRNVIGTFVLDGSFVSGTTEAQLESAKTEAAKRRTETPQTVKLPVEKAELAALVKRSEENCPYQRNSKGETYGPVYSSGEVGYDPVWIPARATNGADGYMRSKALTAGGPGSYPVCNLEGNVIGKFVIEKYERPAGYRPDMSLEEASALIEAG